MRLTYLLTWTERQEPDNLYEHQIDADWVDWINEFLKLTPSGEGRQTIPLNDVQVAAIARVLSIVPDVGRFEYAVEIQRIHVRSP